MGCGWSAGEYEVEDVEVFGIKWAALIDGLALFRVTKEFDVAAISDVESDRSHFAVGSPHKATSTRFHLEDSHLPGSPSDRRGDFSLTRKVNKG
jgi:hypothetical protein